METDIIGGIDDLIDQLPEDILPIEFLRPTVYGMRNGRNPLISNPFGVVPHAVLPRIHALEQIIRAIRHNPSDQQLYRSAMGEVALLNQDVEEMQYRIERLESGQHSLRNYYKALKGALTRLRKEMASPEEASWVGSSHITLNKGDQWVFSVAAAYTFTGVDRKVIAREPYMYDQNHDGSAFLDATKTLFRRWATGEPLLLDLYTAQEDGATLSISTDQIGGNLYKIMVDSPLIVRKAIYFGSQRDVIFRAHTPFSSLTWDTSLGEAGAVVKDALYGPSWIYQRFLPGEGDQRTLYLNIEGDCVCETLGENDSLLLSPEHSKAWDPSVRHELVRFGRIHERLLAGSPPYIVKFSGPGRIWYSNASSIDGYFGYVATPANLVNRVFTKVKGMIS